MKYLKNDKNEVFAFEADGSQDAFIPAHLVPITEAEADAIRFPPPTKEQQEAAVVAAVQSHLDAPAHALGYDDIKTAVTYADEPSVPLFQQQGQAFRSWRSLVWAKCYTVLAQVDSGSIPAPTIDELVAMLPALVLP